jgi:hypothetical protein
MGADIGRHAVRITTVTDDNGGKDGFTKAEGED